MKKLITALLLAFSLAAHALDLDEAKASGLVGERPDGYLGVVHGGSEEAAALVQEINAKRREVYADIAARNGTSQAAVQARAGAQAIERTAPGNFILQADHWVRK